MAQALEKIFLQKVAQMPQEEVALLPPVPKGKNKSKQPATATTGNYYITDTATTSTVLLVVQYYYYSTTALLRVHTAAQCTTTFILL